MLGERRGTCIWYRTRFKSEFKSNLTALDGNETEWNQGTPVDTTVLTYNTCQAYAFCIDNSFHANRFFGNHAALILGTEAHMGGGGIRKTSFNECAVLMVVSFGE